MDAKNRNFVSIEGDSGVTNITQCSCGTIKWREKFSGAQCTLYCYYTDAYKIGKK